MIYLFYGPDEFARSEALADLIAQIPADFRDLNCTRLDGRHLKLADLALACEAFPFLADQRLVIVTDVIKYTKSDQAQKELRAYLKRVPETCALVLMEREGVDRRTSLYKDLKAQAEVHEFTPREGKELLDWLHQRIRMHDVRLAADAARHLIEYAGNDGRTLVNELEKLASYAGQGGTITVPMVELLVQDTQEQNLFAFIDDVSLRRGGSALAGVRALLEEGQSFSYILFMLVRQVRILLGVAELVQQGMRADAIARTLGQKPFVVRKALEQVRGFRREELTVLHDRLLAIDHAIKTGRVQAEVALELLVLDVCMGQTDSVDGAR